MFNTFADDFTLKILVGEKLASMVWHVSLLYYGILVVYGVWLVYRHKHGKPTCHHKTCLHNAELAKEYLNEKA